MDTTLLIETKEIETLKLRMDNINDFYTKETEKLKLKITNNNNLHKEDIKTLKLKMKNLDNFYKKEIEPLKLKIESCYNLQKSRQRYELKSRMLTILKIIFISLSLLSILLGIFHHELLPLIRLFVYFIATIMLLVTLFLLPSNQGHREQERNTGKEIFVSKKFLLINIPEEYIGELEAIYIRYKKQGLSEEEIQKNIALWKQDMSRGYLRCQIANLLGNIKRQVSKYLA